MNQNRTLIPAISILAIAAIVGGWYWSSIYLLAEDNRNTGTITQSTPDGTVARQKPNLVWRKLTPAELKAVKASLISQFNAFKQKDWARANTYQNSILRGSFSSLKSFQQLIERRYPLFVNYQKIEFLQSRANGTQVQITIRLTGRNDSKLDVSYIMTKENGIYRVASFTDGMPSRRREEPGNVF